MQSTIWGITIYCVNTLLYTGQDFIVKIVAGDAPGPVTSAWRYIMVLLVALIATRGKTSVRQCVLLMKKDRRVFRRGLFIGLCGLLQVIAFVTSPLSVVMSIVNATPLLMITLSRVILKEQVKTFQRVTVLLGFAGVCLIIRPSGDIGLWGAVASLGSMISLSLFFVCTRGLSNEYSSEELVISSTIISAVLSLVVVFITGDNFIAETPFCTRYLPLLFLFGVGSYCANLLTIAAFRYVKASVLAPFQYLQLMLTVLAGVILLKERLDIITCIGIAIITIAGVVQGILSYREEKKTSAAQGEEKSFDNRTKQGENIRCFL